MTFKEKLHAITQKNTSLVCVGLDSDIAKLPSRVREQADAQFVFNKAIIDATHDLVCAYKPNSAFYEAQGTKGIEALKKTTDYLRSTYPDIPIILDAKRADIGNTNEGYAVFAFDWLGADAITVHPYLGAEALAPFLSREDKCVFVLCRTSNSGSGEFQDLMVGKKPLYHIVAEHVARQWNTKKNCGLVVGATYPEELVTVRHIVDDMPILIPGIGAQGGDIETTVKAGKDETGENALIAASRSILFAGTGADFAQKAREETINLREAINAHRAMS